MENDSELKWSIIGVVLAVAGAVLIPVFIKKMTGKTYRLGSKVTEDDFAGNSPEVIRREENAANDN